MQSKTVKRRAVITLLGCLAALAGCAAAPKQPFDARRCARTCIEMTDACKASCMKTTDPMGVHSGSIRQVQISHAGIAVAQHDAGARLAVLQIAGQE